MRHGLRYASRLSMADHVVLARCCASLGLRCRLLSAGLSVRSAAWAREREAGMMAGGARARPECSGADPIWISFSYPGTHYT